jgi:hypothetical protein
MATFFKHRRKAPAPVEVVKDAEKPSPLVMTPKRYPKTEEKITPGVAIDFMLDGGILLIGNPMRPGMLMRIRPSESRLSARVETFLVKTAKRGRWIRWPGKLELLVTYRELYKGELPVLAETPRQAMAAMADKKLRRRRISLESTSGWLFDAEVPTPSEMWRRGKAARKAEREVLKDEELAADVVENIKKNQREAQRQRRRSIRNRNANR